MFWQILVRHMKACFTDSYMYRQVFEHEGFKLLYWYTSARDLNVREIYIVNLRPSTVGSIHKFCGC